MSATIDCGDSNSNSNTYLPNKVPLLGPTFPSKETATTEEDDVEEEYTIEEWERTIPKRGFSLVNSFRLLLQRIWIN